MEEKLQELLLVTNQLNVSGTNDECVAAFITANTKVVAVDANGSANVTVSDTVTLAEAKALEAAVDVGTITYTSGLTDSVANLVAGAAADLSTVTTRTTNVAITVNNNTIAGNLNVNASDLSTIGGKTTGAVILTNQLNVSGTNDECVAAFITANTKVVAVDSNGSANVTISDAVTLAEAKALEASVAAGTITYTTGLDDSLANFVANGATDLSTVTTRTTDVAIAINDNAASNVTATDLSVVGGKTTGTVTITNQLNVSGTNAECVAAFITANTKVVAVDADGSANITVSDVVTVAEAEALEAAVDVGTITYTSGLTDSLSAMAATTDGNNALTTKFSAVTGRTTNVAVTINDNSITVDADKAALLNLVKGATSAAVTATLSGELQHLDNLTAHNDVDVLTITVTDTVAANNVAALNTVKASTTGNVSATVASASFAQLNALTTGDSDAITMTVNNAVTVANVTTLLGKTSDSTIVLSGGVSDSLGNMISSGTNTTNMTNTLTADSDVNVTFSDVTDATAQNITDLNKLCEISGTVTGNLSGTGSVLANLSSSSSDAITITVTDDDDDTLTATSLTTLRGKTSSTVTVSNKVVITGSESEITAALVTDSTKVTAATCKPSVSGSFAGSLAGIALLNAIAAKTSQPVTATLSSIAQAVLLDTANAGSGALATDSNDVISLTISDAVTVEQGKNIVAKTSKTDVTFTTGISDESTNYLDGNSTSTNFDSLTAKAGAINAVITDTMANVTADNVTALNAVLTKLANGTLTVTVNGNFAQLNSLNTDDDPVTMTVNDAVTAANVTTLLGKTSQTTIALSGGVSDSLANMINAGAATAKSDLTNTLNADPNVAVTVSTVANATAANITDYNKLTELVKAGGGTITGTIDGNLAQLKNLSASTGALTITVDDAVSGSSGVTDLNTVKSSTSGTVTAATVSGQFDELNALSTGGSDSVSMTVSDTVTVANVATLLGKTSQTTMVLSGGVSDSLSNLIFLDTGDNTVKAKTNLTSTLTADSDVAITVTTITDATATNVTHLNTLAGLVDNDKLTLTITGTVEILKELTTHSSDNLTITITDAADTEINATDLSTIGGNTDGTVTVSNAIIVNGNTAQITAALVTAATKVTAATCKPAISDTPTIAQVSAIANVSGPVTATLASHTKAELDDLANTGSTDAIAITVSDVVTAAEGAAIVAKTGGAVAFSADDAITDEVANLTKNSDSSISDNLSSIVGKDDDVKIKVSDTVTAAQGHSIASSSTGTITFAAGVTDSATNLTNNDAISTNLTTITDETGAANINITVNSGSLNVAQAAAIVAVNGTGVIALHTDGLVDSPANLFNGNALHANLSALLAEDGDINITVNSSACNVTQALALMAGTTGTVVFSSGVSDTDTNFQTANGNTTNLGVILAADDNATITVTTVNIEQAKVYITANNVERTVVFTTFADSLTNILTAIAASELGTDSNVIANNNSITNTATSVSVMTGDATIANATTLNTIPNLNNKYNVVDSATNFGDGSSHADEINNANNVTIGAADDQLTAAVATTLADYTNTGTTTYHLSDSSANILNSDNATGLAGATSVALNTNISVSGYDGLDQATKNAITSYNVEDSMTNIGNGTASILNGATNIIVSGTITAANAATVHAFTNSGTNTYTIADSVTNYISGTQAATEAAQSATIAAGQSNPTFAQSTSLYNKGNNIVYSIEDTAANVPGAATDGMNNAVDITITGNVDRTKAITLFGATNTGLKTYSVEDTAANIASGGNALVIAGSLTVSGTGKADLSQVTSIQAIGSSSKLKTDADALLASITTNITGATDGTYTVTGASSSGAGRGATLSVTVDSGAVSAITVTKQGHGYASGETITIAKANIGEGDVDNLVITLEAGDLTAISQDRTFSLSDVKANLLNANSDGKNANYTSAINAKLDLVIEVTDTIDVVKAQLLLPRTNGNDGKAHEITFAEDVTGSSDDMVTHVGGDDANDITHPANGGHIAVKLDIQSGDLTTAQAAIIAGATTGTVVFKKISDTLDLITESGTTLTKIKAVLAKDPNVPIEITGDTEMTATRVTNYNALFAELDTSEADQLTGSVFGTSSNIVSMQPTGVDAPSYVNLNIRVTDTVSPSNIDSLIASTGNSNGSTLVLSPSALVSTTLNGALANDATTITLTDASSFTDGKAIVQIGQELVMYNGVSGNVLQNCVRGAYFTGAEAHNSGATVTLKSAFTGTLDENAVVTTVSIEDSGLNLGAVYTAAIKKLDEHNIFGCIRATDADIDANNAALFYNNGALYNEGYITVETGKDAVKLTASFLYAGGISFSA